MTLENSERRHSTVSLAFTETALNTTVKMLIKEKSSTQTMSFPIEFSLLISRTTYRSKQWSITGLNQTEWVIICLLSWISLKLTINDKVATFWTYWTHASLISLAVGRILRSTTLKTAMRFQRSKSSVHLKTLQEEMAWLWMVVVKRPPWRCLAATALR